MTWRLGLHGGLSLPETTYLGPMGLGFRCNWQFYRDISAFLRLCVFVKSLYLFVGLKVWCRVEVRCYIKGAYMTLYEIAVP